VKNSGFRIEKDFLGEKKVPANALYGIHSVRARENFPDSNLFHPEWYSAMGQVKKACYLTAGEFFVKASKKTDVSKLHIRFLPSEKINALVRATDEIIEGKYYDHFIVPAISGGAGTSINLNMNEIIANRALSVLGYEAGTYDIIDPIEDANIFQSTNDIVPTALKVAALRLLVDLEESINSFRHEVELLENKYANHLRKGYTQMQEAVPSSFGRLFSTYSDALSRDWWRVSKCFERIKIVNLGGSAIGSGITVPRYFLMEATRRLKEISGTPVTRGENLFDATNNMDSIVEVHGILKAHAVNLEKIVSDLRLLSSDIASGESLEIPQKQVGSSIMPGKVNPVIPEFVISSAHRIYANDSVIASLSAQGCLELNAYVPLIGHCLLESVKLLIACNKTIKDNLINGLEIQNGTNEGNVLKSPSVTTAIVPYVGYNKAAGLARHMKEHGKTIFESNRELQILPEDKLKAILNPQNLLQTGFTLNDLQSVPDKNQEIK
jgi:aspartate ammonia-lyase